MTGGSTSIRGFYHAAAPGRRGGARDADRGAAAEAGRWIRIALHDGAGLGRPCGQQAQRIAYGELADAAAKLPVPDGGRAQGSQRRSASSARRPSGSTSPARSTARAMFGIDVKLPGMKIATVAASPVFGGTLASVDEAAALKVPGVRQVVRLDNAVAVIADHYWAAKQGLEAAASQFDDGPNASLATADIVAALAKASEDSRRGRAETRATPPPRWQAAATKVEAIYEAPFLAHATMEPMNCTVHVTRRRLRHLGRHAGPERRAAGRGSKLTGLQPEQVRHPQPPSRRRLRPAARVRLHRPGGADREAGRSSR